MLPYKEVKKQLHKLNKQQRDIKDTLRRAKTHPINDRLFRQLQAQKEKYKIEINRLLTSVFLYKKLGSLLYTLKKGF